MKKLIAASALLIMSATAAHAAAPAAFHALLAACPLPCC
jgi:hypothetical protein